MGAYSTIFFDLDDTLYPPSTGVWPAIGSRIDLYIHERLNIPWEQVSDLRHSLFKSYGTTMRGLQALYHIDKYDYLYFVHDLPLDEYLIPDPSIRTMLDSLPQRKLIFTNADVNHALRVLHVLGLDGCFEQIIDILDIEPYCKPQPGAFNIALQRAGETDAHRCVLVDDSLPNLVTAKQMGFFTIRVGGTISPDECHSCIAKLAELPQALQDGKAEEYLNTV